jgi:hypothetical protein
VSDHGIHYASGRRPGGEIIRSKPYEDLPWLTTKLTEEGYHCIAVSANDMAVPPEMGFHRRLIPSRHAWLKHGLGAMGDRLFPTSRRLSEVLRWKMPYADAKATVDLAMRAAPEGDTPLFLFVNLLDAHSPYNPPASALRDLGVRGERVFDRYWTHRDLTRQWEQFGDGAAGALADLYDGELRWIDRHLERLLAWIDDRYGEDALVIITSDHGEELGEEGRVGHEYGLSQRLIHVPLILKARFLDPGTLESVTSLVSLYGFMVEAASGHEPSASILARPGIYSAISERYPSRYNSLELGEGYDRVWVSVIEGNHKAVGPSPYGFEFFEIPEDAFNLEVSVPSGPVAEALQQKIDDYWRDHRDVRDRPQDEEGLSEEGKRRLRSLGYIQ